MKQILHGVILAALVLSTTYGLPTMAAKSSLESSGLLHPSVAEATVKATSASKQQYRYRAETYARAKKQGKVITSGATWSCRGKRCTVKRPWPKPYIGECQSLASQVGRIRSYGYSGKQLSSSQLKGCNTVIAKKKPTPKPFRQLKKPSSASTLLPKGPAVPPGVIESIKKVSPAPQSGQALKAKSGFALTRPSQAKVPSPDVIQPGKPRRGFALAKGKEPPRSTLPPEKKVMHLLGGRLDKKEADVDRKTRATKELEGNSKPSASRANQTPQRGGFAPRQSSAGGRAAGVSMSAGGGFAPAGVAKQASLRTALSPQQVAAINLRKGYWQDYQRAIQARRRREEAQARERMARLSREAYLSGADCDDSDPEIHPGLLEVCDGKDNNCDGNVDEGTTILAYADLDGDMHGDASTAQEVCPSDITAAQREGRWLSTVGNDCDDQDPDQWNDCRTGGSSE